MQNLASALRQSIEAKNYYAAIFLSLSLPDICGKIDNPTLGSRERYIKWFDKYLKNQFTYKIGPDHIEQCFLSGNDFYAMRCSILHEGSIEIENQKAQERITSFSFSTGLSHCNYFSNGTKEVLQLNISIFCQQICDAIDRWISHHNISKSLIDISQTSSIMGNTFD